MAIVAPAPSLALSRIRRALTSFSLSTPMASSMARCRAAVSRRLALDDDLVLPSLEKNHNSPRVRLVGTAALHVKGWERKGASIARQVGGDCSFAFFRLQYIIVYDVFSGGRRRTQDLIFGTKSLQKISKYSGNVVVGQLV